MLVVKCLLVISLVRINFLIDDMGNFKQKIRQLALHEGLMKYAKNTSWLMGEKILRMFVGLFVGIWVARYLGPEQFGLLSYAQSFVFLFTAIATLGLDSIVVRELVHDDSQRDVLLGTSFVLKLVGVLFVFPLLWFGVALTDNDVFVNTLIFITASATIFQSFNVIDFYYQSLVMSKYVAIANTVTLALSSLLKIALIFNQSPLILFAWIGVFDAVVLAVGLVYFYVKKTNNQLSGWRFDKKIAKKLLKDSSPLIISSLMISLYMRIDQIMIKEMIDSNAVGQYAAALRISEAWYFIPIAICNSLFPALANAKKNSEEMYYQRLKNLYSLVIWIAIPISLTVSFLSNEIISLLYGMDFLPSSEVLIIHIWSSVFIFIGVVKSNHLVINNLNSLHLKGVVLAVILNIFLNLVFIPVLEVKGAALATFITQIFSVIIVNLFFKDLRVQNKVILRALLLR